jgi:3-dehydroquinate dehydratase/shikimate dehydrogenase
LNTQALIVATLTAAPTEERLVELSASADVLEVRADLVKGLDTEWLRSVFSGQLLYTLRSREEGGRSESSGDRRHQRIVEASREFDLVDLEMQRDFTPELLSSIQPSQRIISWHGPPSSLASLQRILGQMSSAAARNYKIIPGADQPRQEMAPLALLHSAGREDLIAFASGPIGTWTRLIAPRLGAPVVYGATSDVPGAPGQLTVERLVTDFDLPRLAPVRELFGLVGDGIEHSLSPRLHNHFYRRLEMPYLYLPFHVEAFGEFWLEVVESGAFEELGFRLQGLSVTSPFKRIASAVGGACSPLVEWLGSANTLVCRQGVWEAESTDGEGVAVALQAHVGDVEGLPAVVVGAGGAGRAAVTALRDLGAEVTLVNRDEERGKRAARELRVPYRNMAGFDPAEARILVHATPLGRAVDDPLPVDPSRLAKEAVVVDLVYLPDRATRLVQEARAAGRQALDGREVLVGQALSQFRLMTGHDMPYEEARKTVGLP